MTVKSSLIRYFPSITGNTEDQGIGEVEQESSKPSPSKKSFKAKANLKVSIPSSPGQRNRSGSSFGLSTPDVIPNLMEPNNDLMSALRKLRQTTFERRDEFELPSADTTIYLGSDMIDLTRILPPMTPDTAAILERTKHPLLIQEPPTPFRGELNYHQSSQVNPFFRNFGAQTFPDDGIYSTIRESDERRNSNDKSPTLTNEDEGSSSPGSIPIVRDNESQTEDGYISREDTEDSDEPLSESEFPFHSRPRLSLEEYQKEAMEKIEQVSMGVKKMYLLEMDEASECYWES